MTIEQRLKKLEARAQAAAPAHVYIINPTHYGQPDPDRAAKAERLRALAAADPNAIILNVVYKSERTAEALR